jgi:hypothetical protein
VIYYTCGDFTSFIDQRWYEDGCWGWNVEDGRTVFGVVSDEDLIRVYSDKDKKRLDRDVPGIFYSWENRPGTDVKLETPRPTCDRNQSRLNSTDVNARKFVSRSGKMTNEMIGAPEEVIYADIHSSLWNVLITRFVPGNGIFNNRYMSDRMGNLNDARSPEYSRIIRIMSDICKDWVDRRGIRPPTFDPRWVYELADIARFFVTYDDVSRSNVSDALKRLFDQSTYAKLFKENTLDLVLEYTSLYLFASYAKNKENVSIRRSFFRDEEDPVTRQIRRTFLLRESRRYDPIIDEITERDSSNIRTIYDRFADRTFYVIETTIDSLKDANDHVEISTSDRSLLFRDEMALQDVNDIMIRVNVSDSCTY